MSIMIKRWSLFGLGLCLLWAAPILGEGAVDAQKQRIQIALGEEPPQLNSTKSTDQASFFVLGHVKEGLLRYDKRRRLAPGVAERWEINAEGATFYLRQDARWSDGKAVTAHDFAFSWKLAVDPANASQYAFIMYPIRNAEAVNQGQMPLDSLAVTVVDNHTLKVEFERPCGYFLSLTAFGTYFPVREDFYRSRGERYAADAQDLLFNGPFKLASWVHGASLRLEKNEHYWGREAVKLDIIDAPYMTTDTRARFNLFKDGNIATTGLDSETLKDALAQKYKIRKFADGAVFYLEFNFRDGRLTGNKKLRQAIQAIYDPRELVDKVIAIPGNVPGRSLFPEWLQGVEKSFRKEYPAPEAKVDIAVGRRLLEEARGELGLDAWPPLVLLTGQSPTSAKQAEYLQNLFKETLGLDLKIDKQTFKQRLAKMTSGDFDIVAAGWGPDFNDPMTFGDLFASWNENNRGRYANDGYDRQVRLAQDSADAKTRMQAFAEIQRIIFADVAILPQYERGSVYVQHPKLKGVLRNIIGTDPDYTYARVAE
jgi:oligopeptide transport system substrate-binding protein